MDSNYFLKDNSSSSDSEWEIGSFVVEDDEPEVNSLKREREPSAETKRQKTESAAKVRHVADPIMHELCLSSAVVGRETEAIQIIQWLQINGRCICPILIARKGTGKMSIIGKVADLYNTVYKTQYPNTRIFCIDGSELLAEHRTAKEGGDIVAEQLSRFIKKAYMACAKPPILYFKDIDKLYKFKQIKDYLHSVFQQPCQYIASISGEVGNAKVAKIINNLRPYNFRDMLIKPLPIEDVATIIQDHISLYPINTAAKYTIGGINLAIMLANKYYNNIPPPFNAINLIQECAISLDFQKKKLKITTESVAEFVGKNLKINPDRLLNSTIFNRQQFFETLRKAVVGQDHGLEIVTKQVAKDKLQILDPHKPKGVFMFAGPSGVGKTELALQLANLISEDTNAFMQIDCAELIEEHSISKLIGSPPGYLNNEEGGRLTEALKQNPHRVILFDEIEKANKSITNMLLGVFDHGKLTDGKGKIVDCTKAYFVMTTNVGSKDLCKMASDTKHTPKSIGEALMPLLIEAISPEFCNRLTAMIPFMPIKKEDIPKIIIAHLERLKMRYAISSEKELQWTEAVLKHFESIDFDQSLGMRNFCKKIEQAVEDALVVETEKQGKYLRGKVILNVDGGNVIVTI